MYTHYVNLSDSTVWRSQHRFLYLFYFNAFISALCQSIILPGLWSLVTKHNESLMVLGYLVFTYIVGEISGSILFGHMHDCFSSKRSLIFSFLIGLAGAVLYTAITYIQIDDSGIVLWLAIVARFMHGVWAGGHSTIQQAYTSEVVVESFKLKALSEIGFIGTIGQAIGPIIGSLLVYYEHKVGHPIYTTNGAILSACILVMLLLSIIFFREVKEKKRHRRDILSAANEDVQNGFGVTICLFIWCAHFMAFSAIETISTPLFTKDSMDRNLSEDVIL